MNRYTWAALFLFGFGLLGVAVAIAIDASQASPFPNQIQAWCAHDWQNLASEHCK